MSALQLQEWSEADEGSSAWRWRVHLVGPADELERVERVDYILPTTFPAPLRTVTDRASAFALDGITWDDFECVARVHTGGEAEVLRKRIRLPREDETLEAGIDTRSFDARSRRPLDIGHGGERLTRSVLMYLGLTSVVALLLLVAALADSVLPMSPEQQLLLVAAFSGAAGASVDALQAAIELAGGRGVSRSWLTFFLLRPFIGLLVAALIYLVIRGGLFSSAATPGDIRAIGVAITGFIAGFTSARLTSRLQRMVAAPMASNASDTLTVPEREQ